MSSKKASKKPVAKPTKRDDLLKAKAKKPSKKKPVKAKVKIQDIGPTNVLATVNEPMVDKLSPPIEKALDKFMTSTPPKVDDSPAFLKPIPCCDPDCDVCIDVDTRNSFQKMTDSVKEFVKSFFSSLKHL